MSKMLQAMHLNKIDWISSEVAVPLLLVLATLVLVYRSISAPTISHHTSADDKSLGYDAPMVPYKLPFGLDIFYKAFKLNPKGRNIEFWRWCIAKAGGSMTFRLKVFGSTTILTIDPENIKYVLATGFENFVKGEEFHSRFYDFLGDGIFNADGHIWKTQRALIKPYFTQDRITDIELFDKHFRKLDQVLQDGPEVVDMQNMWARFTIDSATDYLLGYNIDSLGNETAGFANAFNYAQEHIAKRGNMAAIWKYVLSKKKFIETMKYIHEFVQPFVDKALERKKLAGPNGMERADTLLDNLTNHTQDPVLLRDAVLNILLAGRDTTAALLTWALYELSSREDIIDRLLAEFETNGIDKEITYAQIKSCKLLRAVLNETLRMYPSVPLNVRSSINQDVLPSGHYVPPKTRVVYAPILSQRNPQFWGPNAEKWDPDRWNLRDAVPSGVGNSFAFVPFNAGPRICTGQQFALNEASTCLIRFLKAWRFERVSKDGGPPDPMKFKMAIILTERNGMYMRLKRRGQAVAQAVT